MPNKLLVSGGEGWVFFGGVSCQFYFHGRGDFLIKARVSRTASKTPSQKPSGF